MVVYDVTNKSSLEHCLQWKEEIDSIVYLINGDPIPVLLLANKVSFYTIILSVDLLHAGRWTVVNLTENSLARSMDLWGILRPQPGQEKGFVKPYILL